MNVADDDIFGHGEMREKIQLLKNDADAAALRVEGIPQAGWRPVQENLTRIGTNYAGNHFPQCALARAIFADQGVDFTGEHTQAHFHQRLRAVEVFADALQP